MPDHFARISWPHDWAESRGRWWSIPDDVPVCGSEAACVSPPGMIGRFVSLVCGHWWMDGWMMDGWVVVVDSDCNQVAGDDDDDDDDDDDEGGGAGVELNCVA
jgi:hypothetical protein